MPYPDQSQSMDPEGLAEIFRQMGANSMSGQYSYKPDAAGINAAAGQHTAQILYSMPGADEMMGGASRLSRMMQNSLPVLQQKQAALGQERQFGANIQQQNLARALQAQQAQAQARLQAAQLAEQRRQFDQNLQFQKQQYDDSSSFGLGDILGVVGGALLPGVGGGLGQALGKWISG